LRTAQDRHSWSVPNLRKSSFHHQFIKRLNLWLFLVATLFFVAVVWPAFSRPTPPGGDASVYIIDSAEALRAHRLTPTTEALNIYGRAPYESTLPIAGLTILASLTGLTLAYPLFSIYLGLVLLLLVGLGGYLAGKLNGVPGFVPFGLALSYGLLFLVNSATLSNFIALVIVVLYAIYLTRQPNFGRFVLATAITGGLLFVTHKSFSFLVFGATILIILPIVIYHERNFLTTWIRKFPSAAFAILMAAISAGTLLAKWPVALIKYNLNQDVFWSPGPFRTAPQLGDFLSSFGGVVTVMLAIYGLKMLLDNKPFSRVTLFMSTWVLVSVALSLLPYAGVYFYAGRFIYEAVVFVVIFTAVGLGRLWQQTLTTRSIAILLAIILLATVAPAALTTGRELAQSSNTVSSSDLIGFTAVKKIVGENQVILANYSLSAPYRLGLIERRTVERNIRVGETLLVNPTSGPIDYIMLTKPDWIGSEADLDCMAELIAAAPGVETSYTNETVQLFHLTNQEIFVSGNKLIAECLPQTMVKVSDPDAYRAELTDQNSVAQLPRVQAVELAAKYKNTGWETWRQGSVHLVTANPLGRIPPFIREDTTSHRRSGWVSASRVQMSEKKVRPGETATFIFYLSAGLDQPLGRYDEAYVLKADGVRTPSSEPVSWTIEVKP
ncbi:MAG: hypothetical protein AAB647_00635, partial [Patescibacteria group bacterium]